MPQEIYLTVLQCKHCRRETFLKQVEFARGEWLALCAKCGAQNIVVLTLIHQVPVLTPSLRVIGLRG